MGKTESDRHRLRRITEEILDPGSSLHTWISSVHSLNTIINEHSPFSINPDKDIGEGKAELPWGLAISPIEAAFCAREIARTAAFIKGLGMAVHTVLSRIKGRPAHVFYAGCGPFALLAFPLMSVFTSDQVCFTLMDIHRESLTPANALLSSFGFSDHVANIICADASRYRISSHPLPDIIVTETMNASLSKEPQVMISRNLCKQAPGALLIPESVKIDAYLIHPAKEFTIVPSDYTGEIPPPERDRVFLGQVFELSRETMKTWETCESDRLPAGSIQIPSPLEQRYQPKLLTIIHLFGNIFLKDYDCSLTLPQPFPVNKPLIGGEQVHFFYHLGCTPGLSCEREKEGDLSSVLKPG